MENPFSFVRLGETVVGVGCAFLYGLTSNEGAEAVLSKSTALNSLSVGCLSSLATPCINNYQ